MAQISISIDPGTYVLTGNPSNPDVNIHLSVVNNSPFEVGLLWSRTVESAPPGWLTWICDKNLCYLPTANASAPNKPNLLAPGEHMDFQIHVNPLSLEGSTPYDITLYDYTEPTVPLAHIEGEVIISNSVSVEENSASAKLTVFPNPTSDFFQVSDIAGLKSIDIYNIVGSKVRSYDAAPQKQYYVGDMNDGIYLIRLVSSSKKVLKTIRLSKR